MKEINDEVFIDTKNIDEIKAANEMGLVDELLQTQH